MPEQSFFFCERCGAGTALGHRAPNAHYCVSCRLFTCDSCWHRAAIRCSGCAAGVAKATGITAARPLLSRLSGVPGEIAGIAERQKAGGESAEELEIELRLLAVKAVSVLAAIDLALGKTQSQHGLTARSLARRASAEMDSIKQALRPRASSPASGLIPRSQSRRAWMSVQAVRTRVTRGVVLILAILSDWFVRVDRRALTLDDAPSATPLTGQPLTTRVDLRRVLGILDMPVDVVLAAAQLGLTIVQAELLAYLVMGLTNREIADATHVGTATVRYRLTSLYRAIGVHHRRDAVRRAVALALSLPSSPLPTK